MTKDEIDSLLPEDLKGLLSDVDYEICDFCEDALEELRLLRLSQWEFYEQYAKKWNLPSIVAMCWVWPKTEQEKKELRLDRVALNFGVTEEEMLRAYVVAQCIVLTAPILGESVGIKRSKLEYTMIANEAYLCLCHFSAEENAVDSFLPVYGNLFFDALVKADDKHLWKMFSRYPRELTHNLMPLIFTARVLAEKGREGNRVNQNWWKAIYRTFHDNGYAIARDRESFVLYMIDHLTEWQRLAEAFGVPNNLAMSSLWQLTAKGKPAVDNVSPLSRSGSGSCTYYIDTTWRQWQDDYRQLEASSIAQKELDDKFGNNNMKRTMCSIATRLTEWIDLVTSTTAKFTQL